MEPAVTVDYLFRFSDIRMGRVIFFKYIKPGEFPPGSFAIGCSVRFHQTSLPLVIIGASSCSPWPFMIRSPCLSATGAFVRRPMLGSHIWNRSQCPLSSQLTHPQSHTDSRFVEIYGEYRPMYVSWLCFVLFSWYRVCTFCEDVYLVLGRFHATRCKFIANDS